MLAAAGLLDGLRATTHWKSAENFRRSFPLVHLDRDVPYTDNGDVLTSAGEAAGITRSFTRRFRQEVGLSPHQWLLRQRVERARQLLERTDLPVDRVAAATGFTTTVSLRQHFSRTLGVSPSRYRHTFRGYRHTST